MRGEGVGNKKEARIERGRIMSTTSNTCHSASNNFGAETICIIVTTELLTRIACFDNSTNELSFLVDLVADEDEDLAGVAVFSEVRQWLVGEREIGMIKALVNQ
jgi:hypothetical protein